MPSFSSVRPADKWLPSTNRMTASFCDVALSADLAWPNRLPGNRYPIRRRPHCLSCFFEKAQFERLLNDNFLQIFCLAAQCIGLIGDRRARRIASKTALACSHEVIGPFEIGALRYPLAAAELGNAVLAAQAIQHDPDLLFAGILLAGRPLDIFGDLLARALRCLSHRPFFDGYEEQQTLS